MSLLEWLKFWSKFLRIPVFCSTEYPPPNENCQRVQIREFQNTTPKWKLSESPNPRVSEYPHQKMKIVSESKSKSFRIPPNENCQRVQIREFQNIPTKNENCQRVQIREFQNTPQNENCQRVQIQEFQNTPPMKFVRESKSESFRIPPQNENCQSPNPRVSQYPPKMKIVSKSKSKSFRIPPNENCQRVQIREFQNIPTKNENCQRVQIREFQNTPRNENCQRVQIREFQNTPPPKWNCQRVQIWEFQNTPPMKFVRESKSESFRIPPQNENCQRVQIREFHNTPPKWKLSASPNPRVSKYPQWKLSESPNPRVSEYPHQKWKLSASPNPRVSEYPPKMKTVRESKSDSFRIPPQNENCQRVEIWEFQNTPPMKFVRESKSESFTIPPLKWKLSESPNPRVSEYPPNENCQGVQIREFQNTPHPPKMKIVRESKSESFRIPPPPPTQIGKTSDFKLQNSLATRDIVCGD